MNEPKNIDIEQLRTLLDASLLLVHTVQAKASRSDSACDTGPQDVPEPSELSVAMKVLNKHKRNYIKAIRESKLPDAGMPERSIAK